MPIRDISYIAKFKVAHWEHDSPSKLSRQQFTLALISGTKAFCVRYAACFQEYAFQLHVYFVSIRDIENETGNKPLVCLNSKASRLGMFGMLRARYKRS